MTNTGQLLADYARRGSEAAFRELVERYLDLVYGTALRHVGGDTHLAQDVAQTVFADLARQAGSLYPEVMLGGWLHRRACQVAKTLMRGERRRHDRERQAAQMNALEERCETRMDQLVPILDEAINRLGAGDRAVILLRFFEGLDLRAVGQAMATNEDAAQKRVARALDRLRNLLVRQGVTPSAAGLAGVLAAEALSVAPAGLAASISTAALAGAAAAGGSGALAWFQLLGMAKLKIAAGAVILAGVGMHLMWDHQALRQLREENRALQQQLQVGRQLRAENQRLTRLAASPDDGRSPPEEPSRELLRLRGQSAILRRQEREIAGLQAENREWRAFAIRTNEPGITPVDEYLDRAGWGPKSSQEIAAHYSEDWLVPLSNRQLLVKLGMALYEVGHYADALKVFEKMEKTPGSEGVGLVWQGHILDLLGRREEAITAYRKADGYEFEIRHDQYGLVLDKSYIQARIETPFVLVQNHWPE